MASSGMNVRTKCHEHLFGLFSSCMCTERQLGNDVIFGIVMEDRGLMTPYR
jgi:hypothetical protein